MSTGKTLKPEPLLQAEEKMKREDRNSRNSGSGNGGKDGGNLGGLAMIAISASAGALVNNSREKVTAVIQQSKIKGTDQSNVYIIRFQLGRTSSSIVILDVVHSQMWQ